MGTNVITHYYDWAHWTHTRLSFHTTTPVYCLVLLQTARDYYKVGMSVKGMLVEIHQTFFIHVPVGVGSREKPP